MPITLADPENYARFYYEYLETSLMRYKGKMQYLVEPVSADSTIESFCYVLCASVYMCFVVTCWERADLLALVCGVFCEFVTFPLVSWVRCGT